MSTKGIKLSDEGKAVAYSMARGGYVNIRESGEVELSHTVQASPSTFRRIVDAHMGNPEGSRSLLSVEDVFASLALEFA